MESWIKILINEYCQENQQSNYEITEEVLYRVLNRLAKGKPGLDCIDKDLTLLDNAKGIYNEVNDIRL